VIKLATNLSYLLHRISILEKYSCDNTWHWGSDLIVIDRCFFLSFNLVQLVDGSEAVSFSVENKELAVLLVELDLLEMAISGDRNLSTTLKCCLYIFKLLVTEFLASFNID
jgi:hypothetical protein